MPSSRVEDRILWAVRRGGKHGLTWPEIRNEVRTGSARLDAALGALKRQGLIDKRDGRWVGLAPHDDDLARRNAAHKEVVQQMGVNA